MNRYLKAMFVVIAITSALALPSYSQPSVIENSLRVAMSKASETTLFRVLVFFKDKKVFDAAERAAMDNMTLSERQIYFVRSLQEFAMEKQHSALEIIKNAETNGKSRLLRNLWAAYGLQCWMSADVVETIGALPEVRKIYWDRDIPPEVSHDATSPKSESAPISLTSTPEWGVAKIKAPEVWNLGFRGQNTFVAVLDNGCRYDHPDLADHLWDGSNFWYDANENEVEDSGERLYFHGWDTNGDDNDPIGGGDHGTPAAGIAVGDGTLGRQTGVAPEATLMIIRCTEGGQGDMMDGFQWFFDMKADLIQGPAFRLPDVITMSATIKFGRTPGEDLTIKPLYEEWRDLCLNTLVGLQIAHTNSSGNQGASEIPPPFCILHELGFYYPSGYPIPYNIGVPGNLPPAWLHPDQPAPLPTEAPDNHLNSVITVGATDANDNVWVYSGRGPAAWEDIEYDYGLCQLPIESWYWDYKYSTVDEDERNALIKPDVTAPSTLILPGAGDLYSTMGNNGYGSFGGTSAATPHVAGTIALMRSANPTLTPAQISAILQLTAVPRGEPGKDNEYGAGRIDAYQAVLMSLAYAGKSVNSTATARNNGRRLNRDNYSQYHLVFASGGEIFYRKTSDGSNLGPPIRLSNGNGNNDFPCISVNNGRDPFVTWQRMTASATYEIWFAMSRNDGATWTDADKYILSGTTIQSSIDPLPVIQVDVSGSAKQIVFHNNQGLVTYTTTTQFPASSNWMQRIPSGTSSIDFSPTVADQDVGGSSHTGLAYTTTNGKIRYRYFPDGSGNWSTATNLSDIVPGSTPTHKEPTIAARLSGPGLYLAWHRVEGSGSSPYDHEIVYRKATSYSTWPSQYTLIYYESQQLPSISALSGSKIDILFQLTSQNHIYRQRYNGSTWSLPIYEGSGQYPSVSSGRSNAKFVWTNGSSSPYTVQLSSYTLNKETGDDGSSYSRSIAWMESPKSYLELRVHSLGLKTKDGSEQRLEFVQAELDSFELTPGNSWQFLSSSPSRFSAEAESLIVEYSFAAENLENAADLTNDSRQVTIGLFDTSDRILASLKGAEVASSGNINRTRHRFTAALASLGVALGSTPLSVNIRIDGFEPKSVTYASLGHIYDFNKTVSQPASPAMLENAPASKIAALLNNYPNPFNPTTVIKYQIPEPVHVTLKIYTLLGQEVRSLVNEVQASGSYLARWDGKDGSGRAVPSGLYLYRIEAGEYIQVKKMALLR